MKTPLQVAKIANVTVNTVRNWTRDYAEFLSPSATGAHGARLFSNEDVEIIRSIATLRKSGVPPAEVAERLRNRDVPPVVDTNAESLQPSLQQAANSPQEGTEASLDTQHLVSQPLQIAYNALQSRIDTLERTLQQVEARQTGRINALITGIVIGGTAVLIIVGLVLAMGR